MLQKISHRGPDAVNSWNDGRNSGVTLGHVRLAIVDLTETGAQPMTSHDGRYVIVYNGEIYNASYLLSEMRASGYADEMRGTSDTEILIEACSYLGVGKTLKLIKGMFAFGLYDVHARELLLARDRIGEKPLYYGFAGDAFVFASELGAIRAVDGFDAGINTDILPVYLKYGYVPAPYAIYENIWKLMPGTTLKVKCELNYYKQFAHERYWDITDVAIRGQRNLFRGSRAEAAGELERLLKESVKGQMIADVPLGAFLSAGIDSPTVVALMQSVSDVPVRTFTIGFEDREYDESGDAELIARHLGTDHVRLMATEDEAMEAIPLMAGMFGEPFGDSSQIPTYLVSRLTKRHVTVALSGDGGDELFAGYRDYAGVHNIYKKIRGIPPLMRRTAGNVCRSLPGDGARMRRLRAHGTLLGASDPMDLYLRTYETWDGPDRLLNDDLRMGSDAPSTFLDAVADGFDLADDSRMSGDAHATDGGLIDRCRDSGFDPVHAAMLLNMLAYHPDDILTKVDRTAMSVSLETRVPMLDRDLVEFAWTLPLEYVFDGRTGKLLLRDVLYGHVDRELMDRPKKGFGVPVAKWIKDGKLRDWANELLNPDSINKHGILNGNAVGKMWRDYVDRGVWRPQIWYLLMFNSWMEGMA